MNPSMTTQASQLLTEYSADHQNPFNRLIHSICVPLWLTALVVFTLGIRPV